MSASPAGTGAPRGNSILSSRTKQAGRALLSPIVRLARRCDITPNRSPSSARLIVIGRRHWSPRATAGGTLVLVAGSLLDAVDGALARATGGSTQFGGFLYSTLDRAAEAILYSGLVVYFLRSTRPN